MTTIDTLIITKRSISYQRLYINDKCWYINSTVLWIQISDKDVWLIFSICFKGRSGCTI